MIHTQTWTRMKKECTCTHKSWNSTGYISLRSLPKLFPHPVLSSFPWICECAQGLCDWEVILTYILLSVSVTDTVRLYYILLSVHRACVTEVILIYTFHCQCVHRASSHSSFRFLLKKLITIYTLSQTQNLKSDNKIQRKKWMVLVFTVLIFLLIFSFSFFFLFTHLIVLHLHIFLFFHSCFVCPLWNTYWAPQALDSGTF